MFTDSIQHAEFFYRLLNLYHAVRQRDGKYPGVRRFISFVDVAAHLRGEVSFAFCISTRYETGNKRWARFVAIDIDQHIGERLPVFAATLADLGIAQAAFATTGSSDDKGKVIVTFAKMVNREEAYALAQLIHADAHRRSPELIPAKPASGDIELFPKRPTGIAWDGGLVRVLGRNAGRNGPLESALDLDGCLIDLRRLKPLSQSRVSRLALAYIVANRENKRPKWVGDLIGQPWSRTSFGGSRQMRTKLSALARYFVTSLGQVEGMAAYISALTHIKAHSPELEQPSLTSHDPRNPVGREIDDLSAWSAALLKCKWEPLDFLLPITRPPSRSDSNGEESCKNSSEAPDLHAVPGSAQRVYSALVQHVRNEGLKPHCFGIDLRTLAGRLGIDKKAVSDALALAHRHAILVVLHPGTSNSEIEHGNGELKRSRRSVRAGIPAMYGLVGAGETIYDVYADATQDAHLKTRRAKYPVQTIMPETLAIIGRLVVESALDNLIPVLTIPQAA